MAGSYPDSFGRRMAWDTDGTVALVADGTRSGGGWPATNQLPTKPWEAMSAGNKILVNDENPAGLATTFSNYPWYCHGLVFPEKRDIDGWYQNVYDSATNWERYSFNSTNGYDGTWTSADATTISTNTNVLSSYRDDVKFLSLTDVIALFSLNGRNDTNRQAGFRRVHIYGTISAGETPDRIIFLDTENSDAMFTKVLDFGDVSRGQTTTRTFKVKNNSASKTINTVDISIEDIYLNAGNWYTLSDDDTTYTSVFNVGNLGPGATKLLYLKQIIPDAETLGLQAGRIKAEHASLS